MGANALPAAGQLHSISSAAQFPRYYFTPILSERVQFSTSPTAQFYLSPDS
jgi:hypothetical protein